MPQMRYFQVLRGGSRLSSSKKYWRYKKTQKTSSTSSTPKNPKIQELKNLIDSIPANGFNPTTVNSSGRTYRRVQTIHSNIITLVNKLLIPQDPDICNSFNKKKGEVEKIFDNACNLYIHGDNNESKVSSPILAASYRQEYLNDNIKRRMEEMPEALLLKVNGLRRNFGIKKFRNSNQIFNKIRKGESIEKKLYSYRVKPHQISTSISFIQDQLPVIARMTRNAKMDGHRFSNMPVFSLGGTAITQLWNNYTAMNPDTNARIGRDIFFKVAKFMCKKG